MEGSYGVASASPPLEPSSLPTASAGQAPPRREYPAAEALVGACLLCSFVVQSLSGVRLFATPWTPGFPVLHHLPEFAQTHVH